MEFSTVIYYFITMVKMTPIFIALALASCALGAGQLPFTVVSEEGTFAVEEVVENLDHPWSLAFLPDGGGILVTERPGRLLLVRSGDVTPVRGTPEVAVEGQGGLLDVALSPEFDEDALVYMSFAEAGPGGYGTAVARGRLVLEGAGAPRLDAAEVIFRALPRTGGGRHFGSRLAFSGGYLFVTLGERGTMDRAQDTHDPYGGVLRLLPNGTVPDDNPFAPGGASAGGGAPELWSYGHRNAQGLTVRPGTEDLWLHEHGPRGGDEINIVRAGANYGWPLVTYGIDYDGTVISSETSAPGIEEPVLYWVPSIAPSGMTFYEGAAFPLWQGDLFVGALAGKHLRRVEFEGNVPVRQEVLLQNRLGRIRDVRTGPDGLLYLLTDESDGGLYRISPAD